MNLRKRPTRRGALFEKWGKDRVVDGTTRKKIRKRTTKVEKGGGKGEQISIVERPTGQKRGGG